MFQTKTFPWVPPIPELVRTDIERIDGGKYRLYDVDGIKYPSVTSVLGMFGLLDKGIDEWRERVGEEEADRITNEAGERGTQLHLAAEMYLNNKLDRSLLTGQAGVLFRQFKKHIDKIEMVVGTEVTLYNKKLEYAGSADCIVIHEDNLCIGDFKNTRRTINLDRSYNRTKLFKYQLQTALYAMALEEMIGTRASHGLLIVGNLDNLNSDCFKYDLEYFKEQALIVLEAFKKDDLKILQTSDYFKL